MTTKQTGGPAFPVPPSTYSNINHGMTLRDYFAGQALANVNAVDVTQAAELCYQIADAMLKERDNLP